MSNGEELSAEPFEVLTKLRREVKEENDKWRPIVNYEPLRLLEVCQRGNRSVERWRELGKGGEPCPLYASMVTPAKRLSWGTQRLAASSGLWYLFSVLASFPAVPSNIYPWGHRSMHNYALLLLLLFNLPSSRATYNGQLNKDHVHSRYISHWIGQLHLLIVFRERERERVPFVVDDKNYDDFPQSPPIIRPSQTIQLGEFPR